MKNVFALILSVLMVLFCPTFALAEVMGFSQFSDFITMALIMLAIYLVTIFALIIFALMRKWRFFMILGGLVFAGTIVYPTIDMVLLPWQTSMVEQAEIKQDIPDLRERNILYITTADRCMRDICDAILALNGQSSLWVMTPETLKTLDLKAPIDLTTVSLSQWQPPFHWQPGAGQLRYIAVSKDLMSPRPHFDYVIIARSPYFRTAPSNIEAVVPSFPRIFGMENKLVLDVLAAPLTGQQLNISQLKPDFMRFRMQRSAFLPPLFPQNIIYPPGRDFYLKRRVFIDVFCGKPRKETHQLDCADKLD